MVGDGWTATRERRSASTRVTRRGRGGGRADDEPQEKEAAAARVAGERQGRGWADGRRDG